MPVLASSDSPITVPLAFMPVTQDAVPPSVPSETVTPLAYSAATGRCATLRSPATCPALLMATGLPINGISTSLPPVLIQLRAVPAWMVRPAMLRPAGSTALASLDSGLPIESAAMGVKLAPSVPARRFPVVPA